MPRPGSQKAQAPATSAKGLWARDCLGQDRTVHSETSLTAQELQIAQLAAEGLSNREIGQKLFVSPRTVSTHLYRTYPKLGISARGELTSALDATP